MRLQNKVIIITGSTTGATGTNGVLVRAVVAREPSHRERSMRPRLTGADRV